MKKILLLCLFFTSFYPIAQQLDVVGPFISNTDLPTQTVDLSKTVSCGVDTCLYTQAKSTGAQGISINNATSAYAFCQYFDCPQPITVHGADFVAYKQDNTGGDTIEVQVFLYLASADSLPWGPYLAADTVKVDVNNWFFNLENMRKTAVFDNPVVMDQPYIISVVNNSAIPITMYSSDYNAGDGLGEHLGSARIGFNWTRSYNLNVGGNPFDADMFIYPHVSYDLDADLYLDPNCDLLAGTVNTTNLSSPILFNRFYSQAEFNGVAGDQSTWDWGDASPMENGINPSHAYGAGVFTVTLYDTLQGWNTNCVDVDSLSTCAPPIADFEAADTLCLTDCLIITNNSLRGDQWSWTFPGGTPAAYTAMTPDSVCWSAGGTYDIELIVTNSAGSDTMTHTIYIDPCGVGLYENQALGFKVFPNPTNGAIHIESNQAIKWMTITDLSGKMVYTENIENLNQFTANTENIPNGLYIIQVELLTGEVINERLQIIR